MSNPIEPKFPSRRRNAYFRREMTAPDGYYLLPARTVLTADDLSWSLGGWQTPLSHDVSNDYAWTYARKLPDGQLNDDLPVQSAPEQAPDDTCLTTAALATQLEFALHAVYENCRQNHNKGIGAGPLAMARSALIAAGVDLKDLKAPLPFEGEPEPDSDCMRRPALVHFTSLLERIIPALLQHRPDLRPVDAARQAAEMARIATEKAAAFSAETSAPPTVEPTTAVDDEHLDPATALKLYRDIVRETGCSRPGAPVLRMTHDGKVTAIGAIAAPPGYYLLPAGETLQEGDKRLKDTGAWATVVIMRYAGDATWATEQFCYARKLPVTDGPVS